MTDSKLFEKGVGGGNAAAYSLLS